jgi:dienelactone hydrolase
MKSLTGVVWLLAALSAGAAAQSRDDWRAWASEAAHSRFAPPEDAILADAPLEAWLAFRSGEIKVQPIRYSSDGLQVTGFVVAPASFTQPRPVLIWARGGIGDVTQDESQFVQMASWVKRGYIVIGSNYRGSAGSEGADEFAGRDVDDLVALLPVVARTPGADPNRLFGLGFSRGGTMLLKAAAGRIPFRAIATVGAITDLKLLLPDRPELEAEFKRMMPNFEQEKASGYCERSAMCWPEKLAAPILISQGAADRAVPLQNSLGLAAALEAKHKPYELLVFGGGDHPLNGVRQPLFEAADAFFRRAEASSVATATPSALEWRGTGEVYPPAGPLRIAVHTRIDAADNVVSESWPVTEGEAKGLRRMSLSNDGGAVQVGGKQEPMPASMWSEERAQFGFYRQLQAASAAAPAVAKAGANTFAVDGLVRTWFRVAPDGTISEAFNDLPVGENRAFVRQRFVFEGWWRDGAAVFPKHMLMTRNGRPYFSLNAEQFFAH